METSMKRTFLGCGNGVEMGSERKVRTDEASVTQVGRWLVSILVGFLVGVAGMGLGAGGDVVASNLVSRSVELTAASAPGCGVPSEGQRVVLLVSGTEHEPRPALTDEAQAILREAAQSQDASDGRGARGSVAVVVSADGRWREVLPLTPRRADCRVEYGFQRTELIEENLARVSSSVSSLSATLPGLDLLAGLDQAVRGVSPGTLIVVSNGMGTEGGFDLRQVGFNEPPVDLVRQLQQRGLLDNLLRGWRVVFTGLGSTAGAQDPLTKPARDTLLSYWSAICVAAGGRCGIDDSPLPQVAPLGSAPMPDITVPGVSSAVGSDGRTTTKLTEAALGFAPDSAAISEATATGVLQGVAAKIAARATAEPGLPVEVRGFVADPPGSTASDRLLLANQRAAAVADRLAAMLTGLGVTVDLDAAGVGTPPGMTAMVHGAFDPVVAVQMRVVSITY
jgi:hypothetical protein